MPQPSLFADLRLPPAEAIAYMNGRELVGETFHWYDLWQSEHERAFTISRLYRADLLESIQQSLTRATAGDLTRRDWLEQTRVLLQKEGWWGDVEVTDPRTGEMLTTRFNNARLQLIFDTNTRQAYAAGQWQRIVRNKEAFPYARYVTMDDGRVRELHRQWHNVTLPVDHPWWQMHRPPNGYRCRCYVASVSQAEYDRGYLQSRPGAEFDENAPLVKEWLKKKPPPDQFIDWENPRTGQIERIPAGIDLGFAYNSGASIAGRSPAFDAVIAKKLARLSPAIAQAAVDARLTAGLSTETFVGQRPGLFDLPEIPVSQLRADALGTNLSHAKMMQAATRLLQDIQASDGLINNDTGWLLTINRKGVKKMGDNKAQSDASLRSVAALEALVRNAVVVERHTDERRSNRNVKAILRLVVPVEIDGVLYRVKLTVKDLVAPDNPAKLLHALETVEIESAPLGTLLTDSAKAELRSTQPTTRRTLTIAQLLRGAKRNDGKPFTR